MTPPGGHSDPPPGPFWFGGDHDPELVTRITERFGRPRLNPPDVAVVPADGDD